jgi:hypothetical protein
MQGTPDLDHLSDADLLRRLPDILKKSRRSEADLIAYLAEIDARRLYARESASSMFAFCTERSSTSRSRRPTRGSRWPERPGSTPCSWRCSATAGST